MSFISFIVKRGRLSEIEIDVDKDWRDTALNPRGIFNIKEVAALMSKGNLAVRGDFYLIRLANGPAGYCLTSQGIGKLPTWAPPGGSLNYYFPISLDSTHSATMKASADHTITDTAPLTTTHKEAYVDTPADYIRRLDLSLGAVDSATMKASADQSAAISFPMPSALSILCDGFVEETFAAVQTDKTAQARSPAANDLNLNPMTPAAGDKVYIGSNYKFWQAQVMLGTPGVGNWLNSWFYWNGAAWVAVVNEVDGSNEWQYGAGLVTISHTPQAGWAQCVVQAMNLYWIRSNTNAFTNQITAPLGSQVWVAIA